MEQETVRAGGEARRSTAEATTTTRAGGLTYTQLLVSRGWLTPEDLQAAERDARARRLDMETVLIDLYRIPEEALRLCLGEQYECPVLSPQDATYQPELLDHLSLEYLQAHFWMPLTLHQRSLRVVIDDPRDFDKGRDIRRAFPGMQVRFEVALRRDIARLLRRAARQGPATGMTALLDEVVREHEHDQGKHESGPVHENHNSIVRLAGQLIVDAHALGASDIHIEPYACKDTSIRLRVDGTCFHYMTIPAVCRRPLISRVKIMASLDIAERRKPQDGKIRFPLTASDAIEVRVATIPTGGGDEDVVLRLLTGKGPLPLDAMDVSTQTLIALRRLAQKPYGIILCVGPTGSGKTTTLHALLAHINTQDRKIWTAEDPIEITQDGLRQVQVHPKIGFTFAAALRAFLRADPDVIMIGEMRDRETAEIALEASLTGHLVLSTLHTNSSVETVTRLLDLGCDPFNFADALLGILAKRLCRRLCAGCKESYRPSRDEHEQLVSAYGDEQWPRTGRPRDEPGSLHRAKGCDACKGTGYKGRIALHELLVGSDDVRALIQAKAPTGALLRQAAAAGMTTLVQDGIHKVLAGETTYAEVQRVAIK